MWRLGQFCLCLDHEGLKAIGHSSVNRLLDLKATTNYPHTTHDGISLQLKVGTFLRERKTYQIYTFANNCNDDADDNDNVTLCS